MVFCTGQNEIVSLVKKLEKKFGEKAIKERKEKMRLLKERDELRAKGKEERKAAKSVVQESESEEEEEDVEAALDESESFSFVLV